MDRRTTIALIVFTIVLPVVMSCGIENGRQIPVRVAPFSGVMVETRAGAGNASLVRGDKFPQDRSICLSSYHNAVQGQGMSANYFRNLAFSRKPGGDWESDAAWPATGTLDVLGFSTADPDAVTCLKWSQKWTDGVCLHLKDNSILQDDLLVGASAANDRESHGGRIPLRFNHALSLLTFSAYTDIPFDRQSGKGISIDGIRVNDLWCEGDVNATVDDGIVHFEWDNLSSRHSLELLKEPVPVESVSSGAATPAGIPLLVIPQKRTSITVKFTVHNGNGISGSIERTVASDDAMPYWESGVNHAFTIHIGLSSLSVTTETKPWSADTITTEFQ